MGKVRVEIIELEGENRAVAIPEQDATAEDWRRAWMKVRKLRDTFSSAGVWRARLARAKRSGLTWPGLVALACAKHGSPFTLNAAHRRPSRLSSMAHLHLDASTEGIPCADVFFYRLTGRGGFARLCRISHHLWVASSARTLAESRLAVLDCWS